MNRGILYISYDGMLEPLGQSQVLAYLERLAPGRRIHLISFEKPRDWNDKKLRDNIGRRIAAAGIRWHPLRYHKSPSAPATALDVAAGTTLAIGLVLRHRIGIVHARSYVPGLMALAAKRATGASFLFDMRGFWADERVDGNLWSAGGRLYRAAKRTERKLLLAADQVVTLTHASETELRGWPYLQGRMPPISVIPTCADLDRFTVQGPPQRDPFVLGYVGSVGTWYLLDEMLRCFVLLQRQKPGARLLIVNRGEHQLIRERLAAAQIGEGTVELTAADHVDVADHINRMSAAMALIKPAYSKIASAATKVGEYLGCGVPCLGTSGVGDMEQVLEGNRVGVALSKWTDGDLEDAVGRLTELAHEDGVQQRCRQAAMDIFSLAHGAQAYAAIYDALGDRR
ncbi:MAG TPA: glycosyltransferase [Sphingomicrobium sp.]|nr:glycosyltransferase [Sphingomicrobium sp.]